jgi:hypothetical protein
MMKIAGELTLSPIQPEITGSLQGGHFDDSNVQ